VIRLLNRLLPLALLCAAHCRAGIITGSVTSRPAFYTYEYSLTVSGSEPDGVSGFALRGVAYAVDIVPTEPDCGPDKTPCGPGDGTFAPPDWAAVVDIMFTGDIFFTTLTPASPGSDVTGFGFYSTRPPEEIRWLTFDDFGNVEEGTVVGPAPVPEPRTWCLVGTGLVCAALRLRRGVAPMQM